jgi:hypothetical protein
MLLAVVVAMALGATLALHGWLFRQVESTAGAASDLPKARAAVRTRPREPLHAERPQPSDRRVGSLILSYSLLRSGTTR